MSRATIKNKIFAAALSIILLGPAILYAAPRPAVLKRPSEYKNISAKVVKRIALPKGYHEGLFLDGSSIWVVNGEGGKVWVVDTLTEKVTSEIEPAGTFTEGIARSPEGKIFVTDWTDKKVYTARLNDNRLVAVSSVSVAPAHPAGLVWIGERLFVITWTRGMGTKFNVLAMDADMNVLRKISIQNIEEPAHLAWDGDNLWIASWYDPLVYKININTWEIVGSFRSPVSNTTGIIWDGSYMWLTGTYSDLYKLEVGK